MCLQTNIPLKNGTYPTSSYIETNSKKYTFTTISSQVEPWSITSNEIANIPTLLSQDNILRYDISAIPFDITNTPLDYNISTTKLTIETQNKPKIPRKLVPIIHDITSNATILNTFDNTNTIYTIDDKNNKIIFKPKNAYDLSGGSIQFTIAPGTDININNIAQRLIDCFTDFSMINITFDKDMYSYMNRLFVKNQLSCSKITETSPYLMLSLGFKINIPFHATDICNNNIPNYDPTNMIDNYEIIFDYGTNNNPWKQFLDLTVFLIKVHVISCILK
jgi:hypothetical protein